MSMFIVDSKQSQSHNMLLKLSKKTLCTPLPLILIFLLLTLPYKLDDFHEVVID